MGAFLFTKTDYERIKEDKMINFKEEVIKIISGIVEGIDREEIEFLVETPPSYDMGDYAFPCFKLAKVFRKAPNLIAEEVANEIGENEFFEKIQNVGPYVNFFINKQTLTHLVLEDVIDKNDRYGSSNIGKGKKVIVEFSSPNIAKPFHIGHIRSTVIGHSLYRIYKFLGFDTIAIRLWNPIWNANICFQKVGQSRSDRS